MKIALYIEDGLEQIVLTPEGETEKSILSKMHDGGRSIEIYHGSFYGCQGGWTRHSISSAYDYSPREDQSTIVVLRVKKAVLDSGKEND